MTEQKEMKKLIEKIKELESKIVRLEKESRTGLEDQLFFGVIISLVVFIITLPLTEVTSFFHNFTGFSLDLASSTAESVRYSGLLCLILASATRYYGAVSDPRTSKRFRLHSLLFLIMGWDFFLFIFVVNASLNVAWSLGPMSLPVASIILFFTYFLMIFFERKAQNFYASRELIFKKDVDPIVSKSFLALTMGFYIAFVVEYFAILRGMQFSAERFMSVWIVSFILLVILIITKKRRTKDKSKVENDSKAQY